MCRHKFLQLDAYDCIILHVMHIAQSNSPWIECAYFQVSALLDTLQTIHSAKSPGHLRCFSTLLVGHQKYPGEQRISCWPFAKKQLSGANRQDFVFVRPPGISKGAFQLRMDNVWFGKVLFLFSCISQTDQGTKKHDCAYISFLEEYKGPRRPGFVV